MVVGFEFLSQNERKCECCGKKFMTNGGEWGYQYDNMLVCSYSCMRKMAREDTKRRPPEADFKERLKTVSQATPYDVELIAKLKARGDSLAEISSKTGFTQASIISLLKRNHIAFQKKTRPSQADIDCWIAMRKAGMTYMDIGKRYKISYMTVRKYIIEELGDEVAGRYSRKAPGNQKPSDLS